MQKSRAGVEKKTMTYDDDDDQVFAAAADWKKVKLITKKRGNIKRNIQEDNSTGVEFEEPKCQNIHF